MKYLVVIVCFFALFSCRENEEVGYIIEKPIPKKNNTDRSWNEGWLAVPENRKAETTNTIELPFVLSKVADSLKNDDTPVLIMSGGPGNGSMHMANGSVYTSWGKTRDLLVLEQRGTILAKPSLTCPEIDSLRILGLKTGLYGKSLDSIKMKGTRLCYDRLTANNIDLNGYNTLESVEDIEALRKNLKLDKLILYGMSYSCNLMATYAQKYPQNVKALILDSPLPHESNHDEEVYENINNVLRDVLNHYTGSKAIYNDWVDYLETVKDSVFEIDIDAVTYYYTRNQLIEIAVDNISSHGALSNAATSMQKIMDGDHEEMEGIIKYYLRNTRQAKGMRYSVWIGEELPEEDAKRIRASQEKHQWLKDFAVNDISFKTKEYWPVNSIYDNWEWPEGSFNGPVLILSGEFDPWTPVWYGKMLLPFFPNAKHAIYTENSHLPGFTDKGTDDISDYLNAISEK